MLLFLDCEWADVLEAELVSIALIGEDATCFFYAEREQLPAPAPTFVQDVVYPLLDRGAAVMSDLALTKALREFFHRVSNPIVVADYPLDFELLRYALEGTGLLATQRVGLVAMPRYEVKEAFDASLHAAIEARFSTDSKIEAGRHHALVDARVLRDAWLALGRSR